MQDIIEAENLVQFKGRAISAAITVQIIV